MSPAGHDLEREIEESRARLDVTIDRIQDRLSVSGIVDDLVGVVRESQFASLADGALEVMRRNPVPVLLIAAGISWLAMRVAGEGRQARARFERAPAGADIPVLNTGQARIYDPDVSPRHPSHDLMETSREISARA